MIEESFTLHDHFTRSKCYDHEETHLSGLEFRSRISPSPTRSRHRRKKQFRRSKNVKNSAKFTQPLSFSFNSSGNDSFIEEDWINSPRTGYTYIRCPTYRLTWTPDKNESIPSPNMARKPLRPYGNFSIVSPALERQISSRNLLRFFLYDLPAQLIILDTKILSRDISAMSSIIQFFSWLWAVIIYCISAPFISIQSGIDDLFAPENSAQKNVPSFSSFVNIRRILSESSRKYKAKKLEESTEKSKAVYEVPTRISRRLRGLPAEKCSLPTKWKRRKLRMGQISSIRSVVPSVETESGVFSDLWYSTCSLFSISSYSDELWEVGNVLLLPIHGFTYIIAVIMHYLLWSPLDFIDSIYRRFRARIVSRLFDKINESETEEEEEENSGEDYDEEDIQDHIENNYLFQDFVAYFSPYHHFSIVDTFLLPINIIRNCLNLQGNKIDEPKNLQQPLNKLKFQSLIDLRSKLAEASKKYRIRRLKTDFELDHPEEPSRQSRRLRGLPARKYDLPQKYKRKKALRKIKKISEKDEGIFRDIYYVTKSVFSIHTYYEDDMDNENNFSSTEPSVISRISRKIGFILAYIINILTLPLQLVENFYTKFRLKLAEKSFYLNNYHRSEYDDDDDNDGDGEEENDIEDYVEDRYLYQDLLSHIYDENKSKFTNFCNFFMFPVVLPLKITGSLIRSSPSPVKEDYSSQEDILEANEEQYARLTGFFSKVGEYISGIFERLYSLLKALGFLLLTPFLFTRFLYSKSVSGLKSLFSGEERLPGTNEDGVCGEENLKITKSSHKYIYKDSTVQKSKKEDESLPPSSSQESDNSVSSSTSTVVSIEGSRNVGLLSYIFRPCTYMFSYIMSKLNSKNSESSHCSTLLNGEGGVDVVSTTSCLGVNKKKLKESESFLQKTKTFFTPATTMIIKDDFSSSDGEENDLKKTRVIRKYKYKNSTTSGSKDLGLEKDTSVDDVESTNLSSISLMSSNIIYYPLEMIKKPASYFSTVINYLFYGCKITFKSASSRLQSFLLTALGLCIYPVLWMYSKSNSFFKSLVNTSSTYPVLGSSFTASNNPDIEFSDIEDEGFDSVEDDDEMEKVVLKRNLALFQTLESRRNSYNRPQRSKNRNSWCCFCIFPLLLALLLASAFSGGLLAMKEDLINQAPSIISGSLSELPSLAEGWNKIPFIKDQVGHYFSEKPTIKESQVKEEIDYELLVQKILSSPDFIRPEVKSDDLPIEKNVLSKIESYKQDLKSSYDKEIDLKVKELNLLMEEFKSFMAKEQEPSDWSSKIISQVESLEAGIEEIKLKPCCPELDVPTMVSDYIAKMDHPNSPIYNLVETLVNEKNIKERDFSVDPNQIERAVQKALIRYDADKTGRFDYALESAGGSIVSTRCTETFVKKTALYSLFGIPLWYPSNNPRTAIQPGVLPGECWAFKGSQGYIVIQVSATIYPDAFSLEHIPKSMAPTGNIDSAPKDFVVYGLAAEKDPEPFELGRYKYSESGDPLQTFAIQNEAGRPFDYIELNVLSNHGNVNYTCLYRFRIHGTPASLGGHT